MDAITILQFPAGALYLLAVGVVGCRLLMLARRTRQLPELLLGLSLLLGGTLGELHARVVADPDQRKGEFVLLIQGVGDDADAKLVEGRRVYAKLIEHLPPSTAAKLAAEITGAPRKGLYGGDRG